MQADPDSKTNTLNDELPGQGQNQGQFAESPRKEPSVLQRLGGRVFRNQFMPLIQRLIRSRGMQWWVDNAWKIKTHALILVTVLSLLLIALSGTVFYQHQLAEISNRFLRLQAFGPQWIYSGKPDDPEAFPCVFHIETRSPYGNATPQVQIELTLATPQGVVLSSHREKTDAKGLLDVQLPVLPELPKTVKLEIRAERGENVASFQAMLQAVNAEQMKMPAVEPVSLDVERLRRSQAQLEETLGIASPSPSRRVKMVLEKRVLQASESLEVRFATVVSRVPVFLAIWNKGRWVAGRPVAVSEKSKGVTLALPNKTEGLALAVLFDYSVSPPAMLQWEPIFQIPAKEAVASSSEKATAQPTSSQTPTQGNAATPATPNRLVPSDASAWKAELAQRIADRAFKEDGCCVEFLPTEVDLEPSEFQQHSVESDWLDAFQVVLEGSVSQSSNFLGGDRGAVWPPQGLNALEFGLAQLLNDASGSTLSERMTLATQVLEKQARFLAQTLDKPGNQTDVARVTLLNAPIVYDGMQVQNDAFRKELGQFCDQVRHGLIGMMCVILCVALCLVLFVLMMWLLRIPTGGWIWFATAVVVLVAFGLAMLIASQSNSGMELQSTIFQSYYGKGLLP